MKQLTFQFEGFAPERVQIGDKPSVLSPRTVFQIQKTVLFCLSTKVKRCVGGVSLISGMVLATGADTIPQALLTLTAFVVAGACLHEKQEKGGAA